MSVTSDHRSKSLPGRILVVDDHPLNRMLLRDALERAGYMVDEADGGEAALLLAFADTADVVLLDVMMPEMDGFEVCRRLKADPRTATLPVLLVTALTDRENRHKGIEAGASDFISKPLDTVDLLLRVRNAVTAKRMYMIHEISAPLETLSAQLDAVDRSIRASADTEALAHLDAARQTAADIRAMLTIALAPPSSIAPV